MTREDEEKLAKEMLKQYLTISIKWGLIDVLQAKDSTSNDILPKLNHKIFNEVKEASSERFSYMMKEIMAKYDEEQKERAKKTDPAVVMAKLKA